MAGNSGRGSLMIPTSIQFNQISKENVSHHSNNASTNGKPIASPFTSVRGGKQGSNGLPTSGSASSAKSHSTTQLSNDENMPPSHIGKYLNSLGLSSITPST